MGMCFIVHCVFLTLLGMCAKADVEVLFKTTGDINIALIINNRDNSSDYTFPATQSVINSAIWTTQRLNFLEFTAPFNIGLSVYKTETPQDDFRVLFALFEDASAYNLGVIGTKRFSSDIKKFSDLLRLEMRSMPKFYDGVVKATVIFLDVLDWSEHVTVYAPDEIIIDIFNKYTRRQWICVTRIIHYGSNITLSPNNLNGPIIFFGDASDIYKFMEVSEMTNTSENMRILFVPLDGSVPDDLPEDSYVIIPPQTPHNSIYKPAVNILPTPLLFQIAHPIISLTEPTRAFVEDKCNDTSSKLDCLMTKYNKSAKSSLYLNPSCIIDILKIEALKPNFVYNIYRVENTSSNSTQFSKFQNNSLPNLMRIFSFNIFSNNLTVFDLDFENDSVSNSTKMSCRHSLFGCIENCKNFRSHHKLRHYFQNDNSPIRLRPDPWILAFLAVSALGVLFCVSILTFFLVCLCRRDILDGNPLLTIVLLFTVICMYCSVIPICLEGNKDTQNVICVVKFLSITLSYAAAFSLILSRCILLASASKDIGFMSHVAGPVQSFLCLFIFGVQAALSLQVINHCNVIFDGYSFLLLISYNAVLVLLMLCLSPLVYKSQRNYREGKYFTVAVCLITCAWSFWLTAFTLMDEEWKDPMLCLGLASTASILLGTVFIPRTYLMTIAVARNRITSTFPSLGTASSTIDIYRANAQPVYDCVNVATINAINASRTTVLTSDYQNQPHPDLYSCPALPNDEDYNAQNYPTPPITNEKVTRF